MSSNKIKLEQYYPIVDSFSEEIKTIIKDSAINQALPTGTYLKQSDCNGLFFIITGSIKVEKIDDKGNQTNLYEIHPGELCHENLACYLGCESFSIGGRALMDTTLVIIPQDIVKRYMIRDINFLTYAYQILHRRLHYMVEHKVSLVHQGLEERLIDYLKSKESPIVYITHQELALELSSSREVISRKLKQLERQGKIEQVRGKIKIVGI